MTDKMYIVPDKKPDHCYLCRHVIHEMCWFQGVLIQFWAPSITLYAIGNDEWIEIERQEATGC